VERIAWGETFECEGQSLGAWKGAGEEANEQVKDAKEQAKEAKEQAKTEGQTEAAWGRVAKGPALGAAWRAEESLPSQVALNGLSLRA
jgi:hypothetical protein